jgi:hypothetical protein
MVYDYVITLKKSNYRFVDQVSLLMLFFSIVAFCYFYLIHPKSGLPYLFFVLAILLAAVVTFYKARQTGIAYYRIALLLSAVGWLYAIERNIWMAILYAIAGLIEKQVKFPEEIGFSEKEITFNTFPKKRLPWKDVNNALIKEGIITIDQKNNKLFQKEIDSGVSLQVEKEFNDFCEKQVQNAVAN